jgi:hypothetical protein
VKTGIRLALAIIATVLLSTCSNDDEPGPGNISFRWTFQNPSSVIDYYAVVSDTTGQILDWKKLTNGELVEMPYVPDGETGLVTIIYSVEMDDGTRLVDMTTFTDVAGGDYQYTQAPYNIPALPQGRYEIDIEHIADYQNCGILDRSGFASTETTEDGTLKYIAALSDNKKEDLFISIQKTQYDSYHYLYVDNLSDGGSTKITSAGYDNLTVMPNIPLDYPEFKDMKFATAIVAGFNDFTNVIISGAVINKGDDPEIGFVDIPGVFTNYITSVSGFEDNGSVNDFSVLSDKPVTKIEHLHADLIRHDLKTKRISADVSGDGQMVYIQANFNSVPISTSWSVYSQKKEKVRINLPVFTDDVIAGIPGVNMPKDKLFTRFSIEDDDITYDQYYKRRLNDNYWLFGGLIRSRQKDYNQLNGSAGRISLAPLAALKKKKIPFENPTLKKH